MTPVGQGPVAWKARGGRPQWSEEFLREAYASATSTQIAKRLDCTASTVLAALRFYGIPVRNCGPFRADPIANFWRFVDRSGGEAACWWWRGAPRSARNGHRYGRYTTRGKVYRAHVYAFTVMNGPVPTGLFVCHTCDQPRCVNPAHLRAETPSWNTRDAIAKGRRVSARGEQAVSAKLTSAQVREIWFAILRQGASFSELARAYGVSIGAIQNIRERRSYRDATAGLPPIPPLPPVHPRSRRATRSAA